MSDRLGPPFDSIEDIPPGLTEDQLDEVIAQRTARRWADDIRDALGLRQADGE